ncbi:unnamed protein product [Somion occarium]|uniref:Hydrophobin n=1 Tax=Somion occarium TaxID=3059160 RepID=A0ABP1DMV0_9APHY
MPVINARPDTDLFKVVRPAVEGLADKYLNHEYLLFLPGASLQCCETVLPAGNPAARTILNLLGVIVLDPSTLCGITCTPVSIVGTGPGDCQTNLVCCDDVSHGGVIDIGCAPVHFN